MSLHVEKKLLTILPLVVAVRLSMGITTEEHGLCWSGEQEYDRNCTSR